jgi:hypothetical protein
MNLHNFLALYYARIQSYKVHNVKKLRFRGKSSTGNEHKINEG